MAAVKPDQQEIEEAKKVLEGAKVNQAIYLNMIPQFNAEPKSLDVDTFLNIVDVTGDMAGWSGFIKIRMAISKLAGKAGKFISENKGIQALTDFRAFEKSMKDRFKEVKSIQVKFAEFNNCTQGDGETITEYATRLTTLGTELVEGNVALGAGLDTMKLTRFMTGVRPSISRILLTHQPDTYDKAFNQAQLEERNERLMGLSTKDEGINAVQTKEKENEKKWEKRIQALERFMKKGTQKEKSYSEKGGAKGNGLSKEQRFQGGVGYPKKNENYMKKLTQEEVQPVKRCFSCGEAGHFAKNCPGKEKKYPTCYQCGKQGHMKRDCWYNEANKRNSTGFGLPMTGGRGEKDTPLTQKYGHPSRQRRVK